MSFLKKFLFFTFSCCFTTFVKAQIISVNDTKNAADLVKIVTNSSACLNVSGETTTGDTFTSGKNSYGSFDKNGSSFPFANGIVLSTWSSVYSPGPFVREPANTTKSGSSNWKGDTDLEKALNKGNTLNATVLEFDFIPQTNFIRFNYIFASNEYQDNFPCDYSDGFAFLIKENTAGGTYQNLAVLPDGTTVSSTTVHPALSFNSKTCAAVNDTYFEQLNTGPTNTSPIDYAGQTKRLTAQTAVKAGTSYHIKLVIADQNGNYYDSAVFLEAGSFSSKIDLGQDRLVSTKNPICFGDSYTIDVGSTGGSYKWFKDGSSTAILGENNPTLIVTSAGTYNVEATLASGCIATGEIKIEFTPKITLNSPSLIQCDDNGNGTATFDLTTTEAIIKNNDTSLTNIAYFETKTGLALTNLISNPTTYTKTSTTDQSVYAKVTSATYGCTETATITLKTIASIPSKIASTTTPIVNDFSGNGNSIELIPPNTLGAYEYSLDGTYYQDTPLFTNLAAGDYTAFIRDKSNCEYWTYTIMLLDYPRFFTPNGDTYNDLWTIKKLYLFPKATINIFDRYGKLVKQLDSTSSGWDGKYIGHELPATDYWFTINFGDGKIIKGHFSLKR